MPSSAVTIRPLVESDLDAVLPLLVRNPASMVSAEDYQAKLADRQYRPEWTWLAVDDATGRPLAVTVWWGAPSESGPGALDGILVDASVPEEERVELAASVLKAAHAVFAGADNRPPEYHVFVPGDWRDRPEVVAELGWRTEAVRRAGLTERLERLRYEWRPEAGVPEPSERLTFHAEDDDEVFADLFARVLVGSLDHTSVTEAAAVGAAAQAQSDLEFYRDVMMGERSWWRVAKDAEGVTVGFGFPSRNPGAHVVGYLGVLPEHRGKGYVGDILNEILRILAIEVGAEMVRSDTDLANVPMAAAMERAGFVNFARRLVFSAA
ncbi:GNAT family N-acetyltransferase [Catenulispora subtropica]|uniref:GNAT family N-acetyltransferase n=1 Tax=Catenulispora subtropica TaxID=450798 RepID=A0ABP5DLY0_9ACTN